MPGAQDLTPSARPLSPTLVMPQSLGRVVDGLDYWFVIGGHAVRCFCPYRPSRDVDFGVREARNLADLLGQLEASGDVEILEQSSDTVHLRWCGINVSIFVLENLVPFVEERRLSVVGILATKLHAILDRGTRRDFFDLYVILQQQRLGIIECLRAMTAVYGPRVRESLLLRALTYFDDAEREAPLPSEGPDDWETVKAFFLDRVGTLIVPPGHALAIQRIVVDVGPSS
ncbi:MAG: nucleotidyl transferase AbiEii/AbiGii toxin family protein [Acidobacteriota bacterium]